MSIPYSFYNLLTEVTKPSDYLPGRSYVVQFFATSFVHHEGDERSRRNPGHGYPAYTEAVLSVRTFVTSSEQAWREAIEALYNADRDRKDFAAFTMDLATVKTRLEVEIGESSP